MSDYKRLYGSTKIVKHNNDGIEKCENEEYDSGIANFNMAIRLDPNVSVLYFNRAIAFQKLDLNLASLLDLEIVQSLEKI